ncbi:hypothetical protein M0L20_14290 [Spirosoma sp. RP8]|uniref:DUF2306 domain-containing protein n=1 Tax=Spirosoma liriopis TaxID=2937440 RepID=A0ABT0HLI9_9BACT|nr:hypothetical protein [Spirosoma liriopis]MCK8493034.1 hypothetical protein [Spirosoma liriopis]
MYILLFIALEWMNTVLHSSVSIVHLTAALLAMSTGTYILFKPKGTAVHRLAGWLYVTGMVVLLLTAFQIYYLFGRFGVIHWGAVGSVVALLIGLGSISLRSTLPSWLRWHYLGMGASVTGLYAAFVVESTYRLFPPSYFWWVTMGAANGVFILGGLLLYRHYPNWIKPAEHSSGDTVFHRVNQVVSTADR